jgi:hypothetical protein
MYPIVAAVNHWVFDGIYHKCIKWLQAGITGWWVVLIMNVPNGCSWDLLLWWDSVDTCVSCMAWCSPIITACYWLLCSVLWGFNNNHGRTLCYINIIQYNPKQQEHVLPVHIAISTVQLWFWTRSNNVASVATSDHEHLKQLPSTTSGGSDDIDDDDPSK